MSQEVYDSQMAEVNDPDYQQLADHIEFEFASRTTYATPKVYSKEPAGRAFWRILGTVAVIVGVIVYLILMHL